MVKPGVAVCRHCGAILDAEKAAKHGLGGSPQQTTGPTRAATEVPQNNADKEPKAERKK
jgi:hypothetical protein